MLLKDLMQNDIKLINDSLKVYLQEKFPQIIWESMDYSISIGGKRLRPLLSLEVAKILNEDIQTVLPLACCIEMIHTYSLIHDDLPCMDNDDFRRGHPTNHKVFPEAIALLAGDALLSYAPLVFIKNTPECIPKERVLRVLEELYDAIGPTGMIGGQVMDVMSENKTIDENTFKYIHTHKTGKMFEFSLRGSAILCNADENLLNILSEYAKLLGYAFQIADDILDITASFKELGKTPNKDVIAHKNTHPAIYGIENSRKELKEICQKAENIIIENNIKSDFLINLAKETFEKVKERE